MRKLSGTKRLVSLRLNWHLLKATVRSDPFDNNTVITELTDKQQPTFPTPVNRRQRWIETCSGLSSSGKNMHKLHKLTITLTKPWIFLEQTMLTRGSRKSPMSRSQVFVAKSRASCNSSNQTSQIWSLFRSSRSLVKSDHVPQFPHWS